MALILPNKQQWVDLHNAQGSVLGIHNVVLKTTSDTFRVPQLAEANSTASAKQLERSNDPTVTVTASDVDADGAFNTITVVGAIGDNVVVVTMHPGRANFSEEGS